MVNPSAIMKRVEQIEKHFERIRPFASLSYEAFLGDNVAQDVVGHDYINVDKKTVYTILNQGQKDVRGLLSRIVSRFL